MASGSKVRFFMVLVVALLAATVVSAQVVKKTAGGLDDLVRASGRLQVPADLANVDQFRSESQGEPSAQLQETFAGYDRFLTENGGDWKVMVDRRTAKPALISGSGIPWVPGNGNRLESAQSPTTEQVVDLARQFVDRYPEFFGVDNADLEVVPASTGEFGGYLWYVQLQRTFHGIPVERSYVVFRVNNGNLIQFGGEFLGEINVDPIPTLTLETAVQILDGYIGGFQPTDEWGADPTLTILPMAPSGDDGLFRGRPGMGVDYRLVYTVTFHRPEAMGNWMAKIDAHTGEILMFVDSNKYGSVTGGIWKTVNTESSQTVMPMPYAGVGTSTYADAAGKYSATSGSVTGSFTGKYIKVTDSCGTSSLTVTAPADIAFGANAAGSKDCTTPGVGGSGNTNAARSTYYHMTLWKVKAQKWLPSNTWLTSQLQDKVNLSQTCNAYWAGSYVAFFKSGGGCSNTGELPTIFMHEIAHGLDDNDGSASSSVGSSEMYADTNAILMTHASCIGQNFIPGQNCSGYGNACTSCTGIRDADYTKHSSQTPAKPSQLSGTSGFHCSTDSSYPGPCGYEGHCESYIFSEANWTLAANTTYGLRSKASNPPDANTAWFLVDRLFFLTRPSAGEAYTCSSPSTANGCGTSNWFMLYLAADDDDGNLSNGTPHGAEIYKACNLHGVACSTYSSIADSGCSSLGTAAPTLTATGGTGSVSLSWTAVTGATGYYVLRNELGSDFGMTLLGTTTGTTYADSVVANGITYYYSVVGYTGTINTSGGSCVGMLAAVKSATPTAGTTYSISGTVSGTVAAGVTMTLSGAGAGTTTTATGGTYTFSGLSNGSYTVTPSLSGYTFSPTSTNVTIASANQTGINFTSSGGTTTYSISGTVSGAVSAGVTMTLSGAASGTTTTATGGTYTFSGLANGTYTVTPSLSGYTFSPTSTSVTISGANQTGKNFTSTASGGDTALTSGVGVATGAMTLQTWKYYTIVVPSGATALSITLTGLSADLDLYCNNSTTHPTTSSYYGRSYNGSTTNETLSYTSPTVATWSIGVYAYAAGSGTVTATVTTGTTTYSISGTVSGATASGVTMTLTGAASSSTTTDTSGNYTFSGLANGSYTVTPSKTGYTFSPTSIAVTVSGANQTGKNFTSTATSGDTPLTSGVGVSTGSMTIQTWKYYTIAVPSGATNLAITLTGLSADLDLYVNNSTTHPTTSSYYGAGTNSGTTSESLSYSSPTVATWSIGVYAYAAGSATVTATVTTGGGSTTLLTDNFSNTGWTNTTVSGTAAFSFVTSGTYPTCSPQTASYMAKFNSYNASSGNQARFKRSSTLAIGSSYTTVTLKVYVYHDTGYTSNADNVQFQVSTNGTTWTNVGSAINRYTGSTGWTQHSIDISAYKGQTIYFGVLGTSKYGNNMYVDSLTVVAQ